VIGSELCRLNRYKQIFTGSRCIFGRCVSYPLNSAADAMLTSGFSHSATSSLLVQNYERSQERVGVSVEQLSTGKRINRPSDDPSGFVAAEEIRGELIELRSETRSATQRRINFFREQQDYSLKQAKNRSTKTGETPINVVEDVEPISSTGLVYSNSRIDDVFTQLREDKEIILTKALSLIEDTDFAAATAELAQGQVLATAAMAALAYANQEMADQMTQLMETIDETA
jgi:hypothetical protein